MYLRYAYIKKRNNKKLNFPFRTTIIFFKRFHTPTMRCCKVSWIVSSSSTPRLTVVTCHLFFSLKRASIVLKKYMYEGMSR